MTTQDRSNTGFCAADHPDVGPGPQCRKLNERLQKLYPHVDKMTRKLEGRAETCEAVEVAATGATENYNRLFDKMVALDKLRKQLAEYLGFKAEPLEGD